MNWQALLFPTGLGGRFDIFFFWRWWLSVVCTVYAIVIMLRSLIAWLNFFALPHRQMATLRQYVIVQLLRLRFRRFRGELLGIAFWTAALILLIHAHRFI